MSNILNSSADFVMLYLIVGSITAAVLIPLILLIIKAARIRTPVYKHTIWLYCLIGIVLLPGLWLYAPKLSIAVLPAKVEIEDTIINPEPLSLIETSDIQDFYVEETPSVESTPVVRSTNIASATHPFPWKILLAVVWVIGFTFMLSRLVVGWYRLRVICTTATVASQSERLLKMNGREVPVLLTSKLKGPACFGVFHPLILLPGNMYKNTTLNEVNMVLAHELAHIERGDCWVNLFQRLVEACFFFHPLVWVASRQLTQQREHICDNYVLAKGVSPEDYTVLLSNIGKRALGQISLPTVALFEGQLLPRVRNLLDPLRSRKTRLSLRAAVSFTLTVLLVFLIIGCVRLTDKSASTNIDDKSDSQQNVVESLHKAVRDGDIEMVKKLINSGIDVNSKEGNRGNSEFTPLHEAVYNSHLEIAALLLEKGADVNARDSADFTPLYYAIWDRSLSKDLISLLVSNGADVSLTPDGEYTPLYYAVVQSKNLDVVKLLIDKGANLNLKELDGWTAFRHAVWQGSSEIAEFFVSKGADFSAFHRAAYIGDLERVKDFIENGTGVDVRDEAGWTALFWAASADRIGVAEFLIDNNADVNVKCHSRTPLHQAVQTGTVKLAELLISKGASIDVKDDQGNTPLLMTSNNDIAKMLINKGADVHVRTAQGVIPLCMAAERNDKELIKLLIDKGADINVVARNIGTPLHIAAKNGNREIVELLINEGADINKATGDIGTPLHIAAKNRHKDIVEFLIEKDAEVNLSDNAGFTPLSVAKQTEDTELVNFLLQHGAKETIFGAIYSNDIEQVKTLISQGANINAVSGDRLNRQTPLYLALEKGNIEIIKLLINEGADINAKNRIGNVTALHFVAESGQKDIVELLIAKGADINAKNRGGVTPLHIAAESGHKDIVELLILNKADVNASNNQGETPFDMAEQWGHTKIVELLQKNGANEGTPSLREAAASGKIEQVKLLISQGVDVNTGGSMTPFSRTGSPLSAAIWGGYKDIVELLLSEGADVNFASSFGETTLHIAALQNQKEITEILIAAGADITAKHSQTGMTPLHYAVLSGSKDVVELLLAKGAGVNTKYSGGVTPLHTAAESGNKDIAELLITNGADVNAKNDNNLTPLHLAAEKGHNDVVELLLEKGADHNVESNRGSALDLAEQNGRTEIVELLKKHGTTE